VSKSSFSWPSAR